MSLALSGNFPRTPACLLSCVLGPLPRRNEPLVKPKKQRIMAFNEDGDGRSVAAMGLESHASDPVLEDEPTVRSCPSSPVGSAWFLPRWLKALSPQARGVSSSSWGAPADGPAPRPETRRSTSEPPGRLPSPHRALHDGTKASARIGGMPASLLDFTVPPWLLIATRDRLELVGTAGRHGDAPREGSEPCAWELACRPPFRESRQRP